MTVDIKHRAKRLYANPELHSTGNMPSSVSLEAARSSFLYHMAYERHGQIAQYWGRPDASINGEFDSTFYIISSASTPADTSVTTRNIGIRCQCWDITDHPSETPLSTVLFGWNGVTQQTQEVNVSSTQDDIWDEVPAGPYYEDVLTVSQASPTTGFVVDEFTVEEAVVANMSAFELPESQLSNAAAYNVAPGNFGVGQFLKGWDTTASNSVDTMAQFQNSNAATATESMINNSRRCLFQWCDPAGLYVVGPIIPSLVWTDCFRASGSEVFDFKIKPRNLRGRRYTVDADTCLADVAVVARADTTTKIRFSSIETSDSVEVDLTAGYASATLVAAQGLEVAPEGDTIRVEAYVSTGAAVEIKTLSMWESAQGIEV